MEQKKKIEMLENLAQAWFGTAQQNSIHAELVRQRGFAKLAERYDEEANEEFAEAKKVNARLIELGHTPKSIATSFPIFEDVREQLLYTRELALKAIPELSCFAAELSDDYVTQKMIQDFIVDENTHLQWIKRDIAFIDTLGIENYLLEQL